VVTLAGVAVENAAAEGGKSVGAGSRGGGLGETAAAVS
jgi:hypothetical protein